MSWLIWVILLTVVAIAAWAVGGQPIRRAKKEQNWFDGVEVRLQADLTEPQRAPIIWWPYVAATLPF